MNVNNDRVNKMTNQHKCNVRLVSFKVALFTF